MLAIDDRKHALQHVLKNHLAYCFIAFWKNAWLAISRVNSAFTQILNASAERARRAWLKNCGKSAVFFASSTGSNDLTYKTKPPSGVATKRLFLPAGVVKAARLISPI